jgi:hypothetical protein
MKNVVRARNKFGSADAVGDKPGFSVVSLVHFASNNLAVDIMDMMYDNYSSYVVVAIA